MTEKEIIKVLKGRHRSLLLQKDTYSSEVDKLCLLGRLSLEKIIIISVFLMLHEIESKTDIFRPQLMVRYRKVRCCTKLKNDTRE